MYIHARIGIPHVANNNTVVYCIVYVINDGESFIILNSIFVALNKCLIVTLHTLADDVKIYLHLTIGILYN